MFIEESREWPTSGLETVRFHLKSTNCRPWARYAGGHS
jgi:hypothetical protein